MGQMLMQNPAVMQQAQQLVPGTAAGGRNTAQEVSACPRKLNRHTHARFIARVGGQDEDKMMEEALRRSLEELNYGAYSVYYHYIRCCVHIGTYICIQILHMQTDIAYIYLYILRSR